MEMIIFAFTALYGGVLFKVKVEQFWHREVYE